MIKWLLNIGHLVGTQSPNKALRGAAMATLPGLHNAYLQIVDGKIAAFGAMETLDKAQILPQHQSEDFSGKTVLPAWCDSHTHLVFAASREPEFLMKLKGMTYAEIAAAGGGILNSAQKIAQLSENELFEKALERLHTAIAQGTGAIEIKSGYGLSVEGELKMLRVIQRLKAVAPIPVKASFLGAHTYPLAFKDNHAGYLQLIEREMLPAIAKEQLADYLDVFCESGFFSVDETIRLCQAGAAVGLRPKLHVNQLNSIGGVQAGIQQNAISLDHLETMTPEDIAALANSSTIGTLLPTAAFFLRMAYQPARALMDAGCALALASDFNPGSSPSSNMNFVVALSCIQLKMMPEEAINAATINGAFAMELQQAVGSIAVGKKANLIITKAIPSLAYLPYAFGSNLIETVLINGERQ
jgi:imidazolonepropionase